MRLILLICFVLTHSRFTSNNALSSAALVVGSGPPSGGSDRGLPSGAGGGSNWPDCRRCVVDQFEAVLRTVERQFDLRASGSMLGKKEDGDENLGPDDDEMTMTDADQSLNPSGHQLAGESESVTTVHYDFSNGLLTTVEHSERVKTIADFASGVQFTINSKGLCYKSSIPRTMNKMCLPEGAVLTAKFNVGLNNPVMSWRAQGPNNSTLRTIVERRRCLPVLEETFSVSDGYALVTSTVYGNVRVGIRDRTVFTPPESCGLPSEEFDTY